MQNRTGSDHNRPDLIENSLGLTNLVTRLIQIMANPVKTKPGLIAFMPILMRIGPNLIKPSSNLLPSGPGLIQFCQELHSLTPA